MKRVIAPLAGFALLAAAGLAAAQNGGGGGSGSAADAIHARQTHYKEIGRSMKGIMDQLHAPSPSVPAIQGYAKTIADYGPQIATWFPKGSGSTAGLKTAAKEEIWAKPQEFARQVDGFRLESAKFYAVTQHGDLDSIRAEAAKLGGACKSCHEEFRVRDEH